MNHGIVMDANCSSCSVTQRATTNVVWFPRHSGWCEPEPDLPFRGEPTSGMNIRSDEVESGIAINSGKTEDSPLALPGFLSFK